MVTLFILRGVPTGGPALGSHPRPSSEGILRTALGSCSGPETPPQNQIPFLYLHPHLHAFLFATGASNHGICPEPDISCFSHPSSASQKSLEPALPPHLALSDPRVTVPVPRITAVRDQTRTPRCGHPRSRTQIRGHVILFSNSSRSPTSFKHPAKPPLLAVGNFLDRFRTSTSVN